MTAGGNNLWWMVTWAGERTDHLAWFNTRAQADNFYVRMKHAGRRPELRSIIVNAPRTASGTLTA